jgi:hypothetical protein
MSFLATCFGGPLLRRLIAGWWESYKTRHADDLVHLKLRGGTWRRAGLIHNVERGVNWLSYFGMACIALGILGAVSSALR